MIKKEQSKVKTNVLKFTNSKGFKGFISVLIAILIGIFVGFLIMLISNPKKAFSGLGVLFKGFLTDAGGAKTGFGKTLHGAMPIIFTGLAIAFSFQSGLFNIGAPGQYTMGILVSIVIGLKGESLGGAQWIVAIIAAMIAGFIFGAIPGILKAYFNVNEVISGIMLNYIGMYLTNNIISSKNGFVDPLYYETYYIPDSALTSSFGFEKLFPNSGLNFGFVMAIIAVVIVYLILNKTVFGYELKNVGSNRNAAKYAGIREKRMVILTVAISGSIAALGGALHMLSSGTYGGSITYEPINQIRPEGFDGIAVAFLGLNNPFGILLSALFMSNLNIASNQLQHTGFPQEIVSVITAGILYISAFSVVIGNFFISLIKKSKERYNEKLELIKERTNFNSNENILFLESMLNKKIFKTSDIKELMILDSEILKKRLNNFIKSNNFPEDYNIILLEDVLLDRIKIKKFESYPREIIEISQYELLVKLEKEYYKSRNLKAEKQIDLEFIKYKNRLTNILNEKLFGTNNTNILKYTPIHILEERKNNYLKNNLFPYEMDKDNFIILLDNYFKKEYKDFNNYDKDILFLAYPKLGLEIAKDFRKEKIKTYFNRFKIKVNKKKEARK